MEMIAIELLTQTKLKDVIDMEYCVETVHRNIMDIKCEFLDLYLELDFTIFSIYRCLTQIPKTAYFTLIEYCFDAFIAVLYQSIEY